MNVNFFKRKEATQQRSLSLHEKKHEVNLRKNSGLYFQIGLIASLFIVFGLFQLEFRKKAEVVDVIDVGIEDDTPYVAANYKIEENQPKKVVKKRKAKPKPKQPTKFKQIENNQEEKKIQDDLFNTEIDDEPIEDNDDGGGLVEMPVEIDNVPFVAIEKVPLFPGCEKLKTRSEKQKCMSERIARHINKKFNGDVAADNNISGKQRINVMFTINTKGEVVDVKARATHPELVKEAIRAVKSLPKMKPGQQRNKLVNVTFALPITFSVE